MNIYSITPEDEPLFESLKQVHLDADYELVDQRGENNVMWGRKHTDETKAKMSETLKTMAHIIGRPGELNGMYGKTHTPEVRQKLSEQRSAMNKALGAKSTAAMNVTKECPYCNKRVTTGNYSRWHGINCKSYIPPSHDNP